METQPLLSATSNGRYRRSFVDAILSLITSPLQTQPYALGKSRYWRGLRRDIAARARRIPLFSESISIRFHLFRFNLKNRFKAGSSRSHVLPSGGRYGN